MREIHPRHWPVPHVDGDQVTPYYTTSRKWQNRVAIIARVKDQEDYVQSFRLYVRDEEYALVLAAEARIFCDNLLSLSVYDIANGREWQYRPLYHWGRE